MIAVPYTNNHNNWRAQLDLEIAYSDGVSRLMRNHHSGPLQVQRPFYPEQDGTCHLYVLHPPGGVVAGDELTLQVRSNPGSSTLLTTPAAGKFYRSTGPTALQKQSLTVSSDATLEWLPQESIFYDGAQAKTHTCIELDDGARCIAWEIICLGRPAASERFTQGYVRQDLQIWREQQPLLLELQRLQSGSEMMSAGWGLSGAAVTATLAAISTEAELVSLLRAHIAADVRISITHRDDVLLVRYLGPSVMQARRLFLQCWSLLRPVLLNKSSQIPRIWNT